MNNELPVEFHNLFKTSLLEVNSIISCRGVTQKGFHDCTVNYRKAIFVRCCGVLLSHKKWVLYLNKTYCFVSSVLKAGT